MTVMCTIHLSHSNASVEAPYVYLLGQATRTYDASGAVARSPRHRTRSGPRTVQEPKLSKERDVAEATDWNEKTIEEFRANEGRVGGPLEGAPMVLVTHRGRKSGHQHVTPMMYMPDETNDDAIYVFATKAGAPSNPDWYYNLTTVGEGSIERGTDSYPIIVRELTGDERDRIYAEQARRYPGFADYAKQTEGIRTIPVLELTRT